MTMRISRAQTPMPEKETSHAAAILGYACRLPGASDVDAFWSVLTQQRCAVTEIGAQRWAKERFLHPRVGEPGRTYTFAAGVLDDIYAFDPGAFGLSPREVEQVDPQQRILLELTREAFEDANLPLSDFEGKPVGVFVGASSLDYSIRFAADVASVDSHFVTGNALSIISNRISFAFGFTGPSLTIDTACSSSLVAFDRAVRAIESGEVEVAVVAGVNILSSPYNFIGFAKAGMLSPTGLCRPFSAQADGYVRAEGAAVMVLRRLADATAALQPPRAVVVGTGTNSDGRTVGIALPNTKAQQRLIETVYAARGIDPESLAFIEAHGTGTRVGDPAEAGAIGNAIGAHRSRPLPIGSVKSNLGHLEPASGLVGLLKSLLALKHRLLPASLHLETLNETIPFEALNLLPAREAVPLPAKGVLSAAVSSFGFGGTNSHAVVRLPTKDELPPPRPAAAGRVLAISAHSRKALTDLAARYAARFDAGADAGVLANAAAYGRATLPHRLAMVVDGGVSPASALRRFAADVPEPGIVHGVADRQAARVAFVFAGNGGQYVGMGRAALNADAGFRETVREIDSFFVPIAGWSIHDAIEAPAELARLNATEVAQPLLFAIGIGVARSLMAGGCAPSAVLGHSVGEIPAAHIAGALDLKESVELIYWRSKLQGTTRGLGIMAVLMTSVEDATRLIAPPLTSGVVIAAVNSPNVVTIAGPTSEVEGVLRRARHSGIAGKRLDLDYPFHSPLMAGVEAPLREALQHLSPRDGNVPFYSTVSGAEVTGAQLGGDYWWRNVREPVLFADAVRNAAERAKIDLFVEIGPRPVLTGHMRETLEPLSGQRVVLSSLQEKTPAHRDPVLHTLLSCFVEGAAVDREKLFGAPRPLGDVALPATPWQRQTIVVPDTAEAVDVGGLRPVHPLLGARLRDNAREWRGLLDTRLVPYLADHKVNGTVVVPAAALAEMALAAGRDLFGAVPLALEEFDILHALTLGDDTTRETLVRVSATGQVEILSRPRFAADWSLHARGQVSPSASSVEAGAGHPAAPDGPPERSLNADALYAAAEEMGLQYGPQFRLATAARVSGRRIRLSLKSADADQGFFRGQHVLHPTVLDAALHGLLLAADAQAVAEGRVYLPARFGALHVFSAHAPVRAELDVVRASARSMLLDIRLLDADGALVARLDGARLRAATLIASGPTDTDFRQAMVPLPAAAVHADTTRRLEDALARHADFDDKRDDFVLLTAFAHALAHDGVAGVCGADAAALASVDPDDLIQRGRLAGAARPVFLTLLSILGSAGLARREGQVWSLAADSELPAPHAILREVLHDAPDRAAEVTIGAYLCEHLADHLATGAALGLNNALVEHWEVASPTAAAMRALAVDLAGALAEPDAPAPRILVVERHGSIAHALLPMAQAGHIRLAVDGIDGRSRDALAARHPALGAYLAPPAGKGEPGFDLALCADLSSVVVETEPLAARLAAALAPGGGLAVLQAEPGPFAELVAALTDPGDGKAGPLPHLRPLAETRARLAAHGAVAATVHRAGFAQADIGVVLAEAPEAERAAAPSEAKLAAAIADLLADKGRAALVVGPADDGGCGDLAAVEITAPAEAWRRALPAGAKRRATIVCPLDAPSAAPDTVAETMVDVTRMLDAARAAAGKIEVWFVTRDGAPDRGAPLPSAFWGFGRVAMNEYADLDIRLVDVAPDLDGAAAGSALAGLIPSSPRERELALTASGLSALRVSTPRPARTPASVEPMARLEARPGSMDRLTWVGEARRAPGPGEVEIEVVASALNFRDVMFAQGLIGDEMLENGFTGPSLGFECAGTVVRVGSGVTAVAVGHRVMTFAPAAFASHVVVRADMALAVPDSVRLAAAATIPVAFITAWYGLVTQARLRRGEWVLIHGAAGGVGLAALQIAKWLGARIVATAGTPEKRALARLAGADIVLDSRSLGFVDAIRDQVGGVDVVLNSLAGEAMERSIRVLKPFGRFVELGKRDYINNTGIGLRPFARNLSYFGVDTDQLIAARPDLLPELFGELVRLFREGEFTALPYREFAAEEVSEAFRLMQGAGHVGKILIRPPAETPPVPQPPAAFTAAGDGVHLVMGGTGGFGFETAMWLADRGAGAVVVASRSGVLEPAAAARAAALAARGVTVEAVAVDARDAQACATLVADLARRYGRLCGVVHTAMVLDDGLLHDLDTGRIARVLEPKISGARHLDAATHDAAVDYFVLFSSATTLVGNPGQANYVAANAFLEGIARSRRTAGLPALAVAWGAIADVGVLARETAVNEKLRRRIGRHAMTAATALSHLGRLLALDEADRPAAVTCAHIDWASAGELTLVKSPAFAALLPSGRGERTMASATDLDSLIAGQSDAAARLTIARLLAEEIGKILRLPVESIELTRPLTDIGMDSLMSLELDMEMQRRFGIELPILALGSGSSLMDVAEKVLQRVRGGTDAGTAPDMPMAVIAETGLIEKHVDMDIGDEALARLSQKVITEREQAKGGLL